LPGAQGHRQVGDRHVLGLAAAVAGDARIAVAAGQFDRFDRLGQRADLVDLDQDAVADSLVDAALQTLGIGDEQIVADQLYAAPQSLGQGAPAVPVVLATAVLDRADRVLVGPGGEEINHAGRVDLLAVDRVASLLGVVELGGRD